MEIIEHMLSIPIISRETNFWMIRAKRGFFFDEFIRNEFIAIGWNLITKSMLTEDLSRSHADRLKTSIKDIYDESKPGTALNQCLRFCNELKTGDIAVIIDNNRVAYAYIGEYYEENDCELSVELEIDIHKQIEKAHPGQGLFRCPYIKRRKISLIRALDRDDTISPYLQNAVARNWHSLSSLNEYAELILSGCFDAVYYGDKLTVTFRVKRKKDINVLTLSDFVLYAAKIISDDKPETVSVKTTLRSPGDVVLQVWNAVRENAFPILICYIAIFGGKAGNYELNSLITIIKNLINRKHEKRKQEIELKKLTAEANLAEQQALSVELSNIEKIRELDLTKVESYVKPLSEAANTLEIEPSQATIIDLTSIIKELQDSQPQ